MATHDRKWLREFLKLSARAHSENIPFSDIRRQEDTILRALDVLSSRPGVILADEVGMGKTYEALGIAAAFRERKPSSRVVVVTPGPDLNHKWHSEFERFSDMYGFGDDFTEVRQLGAFARQVQCHPVVIAPVSMFQGGRTDAVQQYLVSLFGHWKELHGKTTNALLERIGDLERVDPTKEAFLGEFEFARIEPHLRRAFKRKSKSEPAGLDDLYENGGLAAFSDQPRVVKLAMQRAQFELVRALLPQIDLLIVDEAHKLKNSGSLRSRGMRMLFRKRFDKALFLTATPFQLDISELREVFSLFGLARSVPHDLDNDIAALLEAVRTYQQAYEAFQATWARLDVVAASEFSAHYARDPKLRKSVGQTSLDIVAGQVRQLRSLKDDTIEPEFRRWMIRSLREEKREYRSHDRRSIVPAREAVLPFLVYERFIAELFRRGRQTHKASVEINMVSSFAAARTGALLQADSTGIPPEAEPYRDLLRDVLHALEPNAEDHPKLEFVVGDALEAADRGEKTLIFCSRIATLEQLRRELGVVWEERLMRRWHALYPGDAPETLFDNTADGQRHLGRHSRFRERFHNGHYPLYLALRERYLRTVVPVADWASANVSEIAHRANKALRRVSVSASSAQRVDYQIAKRCVERAAVRLWYKQRLEPVEGLHRSAASRIRKLEFVTIGLDLKYDEFEGDFVGSNQPEWSISDHIVTTVIGEPDSLWERLSSELAPLDLDLRGRVVEQLARYLTYKQVPFLIDLLTLARSKGLDIESIDSQAISPLVDEFWSSERGQVWLTLLRDFLRYFTSRNPLQQKDILDGPLRTGDFARHTKDGESREKLREAFNTPLFPMILVANEVMQEGLDLHKNCRRVVHHDLVWNPAQLEQRVGRIDRLGSKTTRLRSAGNGATLEILYPVITGTIDERLYRVVKSREKWLEFLLGAPPNFAEYSLDNEEPSPLPPGLAESLAIDLRPR